MLPTCRAGERANGKQEPGQRDAGVRERNSAAAFLHSASATQRRLRPKPLSLPGCAIVTGTDAFQVPGDPWPSAQERSSGYASQGPPGPRGSSLGTRVPGLMSFHQALLSGFSRKEPPDRAALGGRRYAAFQSTRAHRVQGERGVLCVIGRACALARLRGQRGKGEHVDLGVHPRV